MRILPVIAAVTAAFLVVACSSPTPPPGVTVVTPFDAQRFLGTWYEIARLDHRFEQGLEKVTANYSPMDDGGIQVINRGYNPDREMWQQSVGKAYFTGDPRRAALKVSFFGPFYGGYHVAALDPDYRWALVIGPNTEYAWILARDKQLEPAQRAAIVARAQALGVDTNALIWVAHTRTDPTH